MSQSELNLILHPAALSGEIAMIPCKSISHRLLICAALAGNSKVDNIAFSQDTVATLSALDALGFGDIDISPNSDYRAIAENKRAEIRASNQQNRLRNNHVRVLDCNESGTTLRLMIPLGLDGQEIIFQGSERLFARPLDVYFEIFDKQHIDYKLEKDKLIVKGRLQPDRFYLRGDVSSQFISGLLFALPTLKGDSEIILTTTLESRQYVALTIDALTKFGIEIKWLDENHLYIAGNQNFKSADLYVEGDFSHAANYLVAGVLGGQVVCTNLNPDSIQADAQVIKILREMGAEIQVQGNSVIAKKSKLKGIEIDAAQTPDIVPVLAVAAACAEGKSRIYNAGRLRIKECDRLAAISQELRALGADIIERADELMINDHHETSTFSSGETQGHNDHRIAMAVAIAAANATGDVKLNGAQCVAKSAPNFWREYKSIGGRIDEQ